MSFIVPQDSELDTLSAMISGFLSGSYMRLYVSNITITPSTTLAALLAAEATFTGYAKSALSSWSTPSIDGSGAAASVATGSFTPTSSGGSGNVYGYFVTDSGGSVYYGAELFASAPITVPQSVQLQVALTYTVLSRF